MAEGDRVEPRGFGSFKAKEYEGYHGRDPKTGIRIDVAPKKLPLFKLSVALRKRVNAGKDEDI